MSFGLIDQKMFNRANVAVLVFFSPILFKGDLLILMHNSKAIKL